MFKKNELLKIFAITILLILIYFSYLIIKPFILTIISSIILTIIVYPLFKFLFKKTNKKKLSAFIIILFLLLIVIIPSFLFVGELLTQTAKTYYLVLTFTKELTNYSFFQGLNPMIKTYIQNMIDDSFSFIKDFIIQGTPNFISQIANISLLIFIAFFLLYYFLVYSEELLSFFKNRLPLDKHLKKILFNDIKKITSGLLQGQLITAIIQGLVGGFFFFIFGIPNYLFWTFLMIIFSFIPFLGTPFIFVPVAIIELLQKDFIAGFGILISGFLIVMNIDNIIRPFLVSSKTDLHPAIVLLGVLGGILLFGLIGLILGPLILGLALTLIKDYFLHPDIIGIENISFNNKKKLKK